MISLSPLSLFVNMRTNTLEVLLMLRIKLVEHQPLGCSSTHLESFSREGMQYVG